jgi:selenocysteine lyase/cysteine desulfurase
MEAGYRAMAGLLNCHPDELTLGPSTTMNFYVLAQAIRPLLKPGDEIIVTNQDHEANIGCWRRLAEFGAVIKEWRIDPQTGELDYRGPQIAGRRSRTRLVCFTLCSNIVGHHERFQGHLRHRPHAGALAIGDGVSFAPHRVLDVTTSGLDFYLFSTYKTFGTHLGVMWGKPSPRHPRTPGPLFQPGPAALQVQPGRAAARRDCGAGRHRGIHRSRLRSPFR